MISKEEWLKLRKKEIDKFISASAEESYNMFKNMGIDTSMEKELSLSEEYFQKDLAYEPFNCIETIDGINIEKYLNEIRIKKLKIS